MPKSAKIIAAAAMILAGIRVVARTNGTKINPGFVTWSALTYSTYAELSN